MYRRIFRKTFHRELSDYVPVSESVTAIKIPANNKYNSS